MWFVVKRTVKRFVLHVGALQAVQAWFSTSINYLDHS